MRGWFGFAKRKTFLIDASGVVARVWDDVSPAGHAREVLEAVRESAPDGA